MSSVKLNQLIIISLLVTAFFLTFFNVMQELISSWSHSEEYSHGFLIMPLAIYIIWIKRKNLAQIPIRPSWSGLIIIIFSLIIYLIADLAEILTLASLSMVIFLTGLVIFLYGWKMLKEISFPLFLLLFMIPIPSQFLSMVTIHLQLFVSKISVAIASFIGIPVYRDGNIISLPAKSLEVVQACSGLRSMITLLTLSLVIAYFYLQSNILRIFLFIMGAPVAVFVNILRVLLTILALYYFNLDLTLESFHTLFGVVIFLLALLFIMMLQRGFLFWDR